MTVDSNVFIMDSSVLKPIYNTPAERYIWVYQGQETASEPSGLGLTFNMNFIAATGAVWKAIVQPDLAPSKALDQSWIDKHVERIGLLNAGESFSVHFSIKCFFDGF